MRRRSPAPVDLTPVAFEVLLSLVDGPLHGYGIKLAIEERTDGRLRLGSGTLYQAIQRLERGGLIADAHDAEAPVDARRGRTYELEPLGRSSLMDHLASLSRSVEYARSRKLLPSIRS
jgi:DNA-binding PadR family transcriptional regulator